MQCYYFIEGSLHGMWYAGSNSLSVEDMLEAGCKVHNV